ncbi:hypothetical protein MF406_01610 [Georgenia sp. TF02-10]|uniref:hypothetical protein n=1 Tax=Georgenia sp. TF02-10 TaxID=2917725 RepID=UPI001FA75F96|nr:hypothetical protein [Georgenia sp. TF02-10]UNX55012.1 hypothetical protein MF406_01610 [Georgenia sp. TF02-10]
MEKPLSPGGHGATDYAMALTLLAAPRLLRMSKRARRVFGMLGATQGTVNALTVQPLAVKPVIPFRTHRVIDLASSPVFALLPVLTGVAKQRRARGLWLAMTVGLAVEYVLTDWDAKPARRAKR